MERKNQNLMNVILTGATGTLGSQVIFELLAQNRIKSIILPVRSKNGQSPAARIEKVLTSEAAPAFVSENLETVMRRVKVLDMEAFFQPENYLKKNEVNYFIHSAGCVNLTTDPAHRDAIFADNVDLTSQIFDAFSPFIEKFTYISTAFSIGNIGGLIDNDYHADTKPLYRNFYEESKHTAEKMLLVKGKEKGIEIQILRPSVLGGNIFKKSPYFISNYMVYYLFGKFFYKGYFGEASIRLAANFKTGLNIIPVDYAAKVIATVFSKDIVQLNIVHATCTNIVNGMSRIIRAVGFENVTFQNVSSNELILEGKNKLEEIYYKSIGLHLGQYLTSTPYEYDTRLLESIVPMPKYNVEDYLEATIEFAKSRGFKGEGW